MMPPTVPNPQSFGLPVVRSKADRQDQNTFQAYSNAGAIPSEWTLRDFAVVPQETFNQIVEARKNSATRQDTAPTANRDTSSFVGRVFGSIPWAGEEVPSLYGVMPDAGAEQQVIGAIARPSMPETQVIAAPNERADAIRSAFEAMRNGQGGPAPSMSAVTSNPGLLAADDRISQLAQLKDTLASMNPQSRAPEPVMPSDAARRGAYGGPAANADRFTRMAILNEQERNRVPTTAGKDSTINLDTLPEQLKQVYTQRAANDSKRDSLVLGAGLPPVARTEADKAAKRAEYESAGLSVPAVYAGIASPEKVRADKLRRTQEESYRQGNYSLQEQARGLSQKLGINPMIATALAMDRMQSGPATDQSGEPRMPDSWEPRLRGGGNSQLTGNIMDTALLGPQGAAMLRATQAQNQGLNERAKMQTDTQRAVAESNNSASMQRVIENGKQLIAQAQANGANAMQLAQLQGQINTTLQKMGIDAKTTQIGAQQQHERDMQAAQGAQAEKQLRLGKELNPSLPLDVQLEGQQIAAERERLASMGASAPPEQLRRLQMREQMLMQRVGGKQTTMQQWPSSLAIAPDINTQLDKFLMSPDSPEMVEWGPDNWDVWHPQRVKPNLERAAMLLAEQNGMPIEQARNYAGEWLQRRRDSSILPFNIYPSRENVGF